MYTQLGRTHMKIARIYLRVSTDEQDLTRQADIEQSTRAAGYYIAGVYREKASGARVDRPELLRMIADLQPGEVVVAEKIDRISRLPLAEAEQLVSRIRATGAKLAVPGLVDLSGFAGTGNCAMDGAIAPSLSNAAVRLLAAVEETETGLTTGAMAPRFWGAGRAIRRRSRPSL
jgi:DNA invertase Pin-like site-specific DNA recombinase